MNILPCSPAGDKGRRTPEHASDPLARDAEARRRKRLWLPPFVRQAQFASLVTRRPFEQLVILIALASPGPRAMGSAQTTPGGVEG
jgi:hypothetical protein